MQPVVCGVSSLATSCVVVTCVSAGGFFQVTTGGRAARPQNVYDMFSVTLARTLALGHIGMRRYAQAWQRFDPVEQNQR